MSISYKGVVLTNSLARSVLDDYLAMRFSGVEADLNKNQGMSFSFDFVDYLPGGAGRTRFHFGKDGKEYVDFAHIGIFDDFSVMEGGNPVRDAPVDEYKFVSMLVAVSHEYQHVYHCIVDHHRGDFPSPYIYVSDLARYDNESYGDENYSQDPCEIDSQFRGLFEIHQFLCAIVDDSSEDYPEADRLICMYQNRRQRELREQHGKDVEHNEEVRRKMDAGEPLSEDDAIVPVTPLDFLDAKKDFTSVDDIFSAYRKAFLDSLHSQRTYAFQDAYGDVAADVFRRRPDVGRLVLREKDGFRQNKMIASFSQPAYRLARIKRETGMDLPPAATLHNTWFGQRIKSKHAARDATYDAKSRFGNILEQMADADGKGEEKEGGDLGDG